MAKRPRNVGSPMSQFDRILASIPARAEFHITMDANSTNEVWTDIDTNLDEGEAWLIYGCEFIFESKVPTVPNANPYWLAADNQAYVLQIHRNDDSELLLNFNDDDLMFEWRWTHDQFTTTSGATSLQNIFPQRFGSRTITFSEKLRALFVTVADDQAISAATVQLAGRLLYDRIRAPGIGQSKLGQIADL